MNCAEHRAARSAGLDGEPLAEPGTGVDERAMLQRLETHLAECADCRDWLATAQRLKAMNRTGAGPSEAWTGRLLTDLSGARGGEPETGVDHFSRQQ